LAATRAPATPKSSTLAQRASINRHRLRRLHSLRTAVEWQIELDTGKVKSRADIARREGLTRAAVTQKMRLLDGFGQKRRHSEPLPKAAGQSTGLGAPSSSREDLAGYRALRTELLKRFETDYVAKVLHDAANNISDAARMAKIDRKHFWRLMQRNGIR
jgi:DNA-binding NtrC family response regulator